MKGAKPKGWRQRLGKGSSYRRNPKRKKRAEESKRVRRLSENRESEGEKSPHSVATIIDAAHKENHGRGK